MKLVGTFGIRSLTLSLNGCLCYIRIEKYEITYMVVFLGESSLHFHHNNVGLLPIGSQPILM